MSVTSLNIPLAQLNTSEVFRKWTYDVMNWIKPNYEYSEETESGFNTWTATVDFEVLKIERKATMINWQIRS